MKRISRAPALGNESGVAMLVTLVTILLVFMISSTMVVMAMGEYQMAGGAERSRLAFQLASAAAEKGMYELKRDATWDDGGASAGATRNVTAPGTWQPLWDGAANVTAQNFPSTAPLGTITVEVCRYDGSTFCPGVQNPTVAGCTSAVCIFMRATGRVPGASRRVEILAGKIIPGVDFTAYSASPINIGAGGGGNGTFRLHGSLYVASCIDPDGAGSEPCTGLTMQGNGAILNDVPFIGDTATPYHNRVYVRGFITGQGNSWQIGLDAQPMWGVHAFGWPSSVNNQIDAFREDDAVPYVPFPDPSAQCAASAPRGCLINRLYLPAGDPDRIVPNNAMMAYTCGNSISCTPAQWNSGRVDLTSNNTLVLASRNPGRNRVLIPDRDPATGLPVIDCTTAAQAPVCDAAAGSLSDVDGTDDFTLVFNGFVAGGATNLFTQRNAFIHSRTHVRLDGDVVYTGFTTFLIENADDVGAPTPAVELAGSVTPLCSVSQGASCSQTFGQSPGGTPAGDTYAFAVGPSNPATAGGGVYVRGSGIELDLVVFAHGTVKNDNPQDWYGYFIANLLDWDNNPSIYPVNALRANLPPGMLDFSRAGFGVEVFRWREVF